MATITLSTDTLISTLMPSGGGSLASGDTIQLSGHSLIIDADAVDYPVTIANGGADANLELRDLSRIMLNATMPSNVHPWIDPAHPLPIEDAAHAIDGDGYRTTLTGNARAEIQLNGNISLGGGKANFPTQNRETAFVSKIVEKVDNYTFILEDDVGAHVGDAALPIPFSSLDNTAVHFVTGYDSATRQISIDAAVGLLEGDYIAVSGGGVCVKNVSTSGNNSIFSNDIRFGTLLVIGPNGDGNNVFSSSVGSVYGDRLVAQARRARIWKQSLFPPDSILSVAINHIAVPCPNSGMATGNTIFLSCTDFCFGYFSVKESSCKGNTRLCANVDGHFIGALYGLDRIDLSLSANKIDLITSETIQTASFISANSGKINSGNISAPIQIEHDGSVSWVEGASAPIPFAFLHAPATASDVTWRYSDRTVPAGATLRLRCAWRREGSGAPRASVAVTAPATWWPQLWPLGAEALASVEFTGGTADWRSELLTWRNTSTEAVQVRVWECVTGTTSGGYLKVEEVKGGAL